MRKVISLMHLSLDGFAAGPNGEMDWISYGEEEQNYVNSILDTADTVLFGRTTYQMMENFWPTVPTHPVFSKSKYHIEHARWINHTPKIVFSRSLERVEWMNTRLVRDDIAQEIAKMKQQPGKNIVMIGSPGLAHTLMQLDLIDEYRMNVNPVVIGSGIPFFKVDNKRIRLKLAEVNPFHSGVVGLAYQLAK